MLKNIKLVLFDLDGVLIDSKKNMYLSWQAVRKQFNLSTGFDKYFKNIGIPFEHILKKIKVKKDKKKIEKIYRKNSIRKFDKIRIFSKVKKTLEILKEKKINVGIVTSKDNTRTLKILKKFKLNFKIIITPSKKLKGKPHPDQLNKAIKIAKVKKSNTVYIGDMFVDYKAAKNAGIHFIYAAYGYGNKKKIYKYSIRKIEDIIKKVSL